MLCRLCLIDLPDSEESLNLFDESGLPQNFVVIISKYFWFEPKKDDPISSLICTCCWNKLYNFHLFYTSVEQAQNNLVSKLETNLSKTDTVLNLLKEENVTDDIFVVPVEMVWPPNDPIETVLNENPNEQEDICIPAKKRKVEEESNDEEDETIARTRSKTKVFTNQPVVMIKRLKLEENTNPISLKKKKRDVSRISLTTKKLTITKIIKRNKHDGPKKVVKKDKKEIKVPIEDSIETALKKLEAKKESKALDEKISNFMKIICGECEEEFPNFLSLKKHFRMIHKRQGHVKCCKRLFFRRVNLLEHIDWHLNPESFTCMPCQRTFATKQSLLSHNLGKHESSESKMYCCRICDRKYLKPYLLSQHYKVSHSAKKTPPPTTISELTWKCEICDKLFISKIRLRNHHRCIHENAYSQICYICAKVCRSKVSFNNHMLEHKGITTPKIQCEKCGAYLKNARSLKKHMQRHEEANMNFTCNDCGKVAPSKGALRSHYRYVHMTATHHCSICDKSFKKPLELREHMATHTGELLYKCKYCPLSCNSSANMWSHKKKAHRLQWDNDRLQRKMPEAQQNELTETTLNDHE